MRRGVTTGASSAPTLTPFATTVLWLAFFRARLLTALLAAAVCRWGRVGAPARRPATRAGQARLGDAQRHLRGRCRDLALGQGDVFDAQTHPVAECIAAPSVHSAQLHPVLVEL